MKENTPTEPDGPQKDDPATRSQSDFTVDESRALVENPPEALRWLTTPGQMGPPEQNQPKPTPTTFEEAVEKGKELLGQIPSLKTLSPSFCCPKCGKQPAVYQSAWKCVCGAEGEIPVSTSARRVWIAPPAAPLAQAQAATSKVTQLPAASPVENPAAEAAATIPFQESAEGTMADLQFREGAKKYPHFSAQWDSLQKLWTYLDRPVDEEGKTDPYDSVLADTEAVHLLKEAARIALRRLRHSRDPEISALASTLREPLHVWLDLMKTKERGFRRIPQLTSWRGGESMEEFMKSGAVPSDARLTENGYIRQVFLESANLWDDLTALGFETEAETRSASSGEAELANGGLTGQSRDKKTRGRPQTLSDEKKTEAARLKASGGTNKEAAAVIYGTKYPTSQQTKNVPAILKHHQRKESGSQVKPRNASTKHRKTKG